MFQRIVLSFYPLKMKSHVKRKAEITLCWPYVKKMFDVMKLWPCKSKWPNKIQDTRTIINMSMVNSWCLFNKLGFRAMSKTLLRELVHRSTFYTQAKVFDSSLTLNPGKISLIKKGKCFVHFFRLFPAGPILVGWILKPTSKVLEVTPLH